MNRLPLMSVAIGALLWVGFHMCSKERSDKELVIRKTLSTLAPYYNTFSWITPGDLGVAFVYSQDRNNLLALWNFDTKKLETYNHPDEISAIFNWSPNQERLAVQARARNKHRYLLILDVKRGRLEALNSSTKEDQEEAVWLSDFDLLVKTSNNGKDSFYINSLKSNLTGVASQRLTLADNLPVIQGRLRTISGHKIMAVHQDTLFEVNLKSSAQAKIVSASDLGLSKFEWPYPNEDGSKFVFCAYSKNSNYRNAFIYDVAQQKLTQLTSNHTYNARWAKESASAYILNTNNARFLAIQSLKTREESRYFFNGFAELYGVTPDGSRAVVFGNPEFGPNGLWGVSTLDGKVDLLFSPDVVPGEFVKPEEYTVVSPDGVESHIYLLKTTNFASAPTVVLIPPPTDQFTRNFDIESQFLVKLGFNYVAVNYRGCDGYGASYSKLWDPSKAAQDVISIISDLADKGIRSDAKIFLITHSGGSSVLARVLEQTHLPLGAIFVDPSPFSIDEGTYPLLPPILITIGVDDLAYRQIKDYAKTLRKQITKLEFRPIPDMEHNTFLRGPFFEQQVAIAEFLMEENRRH